MRRAATSSRHEPRSWETEQVIENVKCKMENCGAALLLPTISANDGKFLNSTFSILNSAFPPLGGTICGGDAPFGGAFVPPCFCAQTVAIAAKNKNAATVERDVLASLSNARASRPRLTSTNHATVNAAAPTRHMSVNKSLMKSTAVVYQKIISPCLRPCP